MNFVPCVAWVGKGIAKPVPEKVQLTPEELKTLIESTKQELGDLNINDEIGTDSDTSSDDDEETIVEEEEPKVDEEEPEVDEEEPEVDEGAVVMKEEEKKSKKKKKGKKNKSDVASELMVAEDDEEDAKVDEGAGVMKEEEKKSKKRKKGKKKKSDVPIEVMNAEAEDDEDDADLIKEYGMDDYDDDAEGVSFDGIGGLTYYSSNTEDPYITFKEEGDSDDEDFKIKPEDNLLVCGRVKKDHSNLDVFVYNESEDDFFIHHDLLLTAFPLAMEWLDFDPGDEKPGNLVAVSSMEPTIGIWDLDLEDAVEPVITLGEKQKKKKAKKVKTSESEGHTDAILDLAWNKNVRNILGSCSADQTVALWDLTEGKVVKTIPHGDKVQSIDWHPSEAQTLASGSFDKIVRVFDCRGSEKDKIKWTLAGEVERVVWNWSSPNYLLASSDQGFIYLLDVRTDKTVFTLSAHTGAVTGLCLSSRVPNLLVTGSADKSVKVWDIQDYKPELITEKKFKLGGVQCVSCCPDAPWAFAAGCEKDVKVWDIRESKAVEKHFKARMTVGGSGKKKKVKGEKAKEDSASEEESMDGLSVKDNSSETTTKSVLKSTQSPATTKKKKNKKKKPKSGKR